MAEEMSAESAPLTDGAIAATSLALSGASRAEADAFLRDQRHHLHEQLKQIHLDIWEKWLGVFLRAATAVVGVAAAGAVGFLVWGAANSNGLRVEPFSVPPDLAQRGLTGQVVAARVIDRLNQLQSQTNTARPARSYTNSWGGQGIKLEIPETGISLDELDNWLREKLGHETHVSGEIVRSPAGLSVTARAGNEGVETVSGPDADIDTLVGRAAESIYRMTQPYRYAIYLMRHEGRYADALPIFRNLALNGSSDDRLWSYNMWALAAQVQAGDTELGLRMYRQALDADPEAIGVYSNLASVLFNLGLWEDAVQSLKESHARLIDGKQRYTPADRIAVSEKQIESRANQLTGAYHDTLAVEAQNARTGLPGVPRKNLLTVLIQHQIGAHDLGAARATLADFPANLRDAGNNPVGAFRIDLMLAAAAEDWTRALGLGDAMAAYLGAYPHDRRAALVHFAPPLAIAQAHLGRFADAERTIAPTPADCYPCMIMRGQIAALEGQQARADWWFGRAVKAGPSLPFAFHQWGNALLARGQTDAAIEKFAIANQKQPHFADPLEGWGEALMAQKHPDAALEKFAEADKYAPNWGRLHLKWGEALAGAGKADEAKKQFARAAQLDLSRDDAATLARWRKAGN